MSPLENFLSKLKGVRRSGTGYMALCPAHEDHDPSLSVTEGEDGRVLANCKAGCVIENVCEAMGLTMADLFPALYGKNGSTSRIVETYDYQDPTGKPLFQVVRFEPKDFRQCRPDGTWTTKGIKKVLFHLPKLLPAVAGGKATICVVEGEKDVLAMEGHGFVATCNPGGAGKWNANYSESLRGANIVIVADKDQAGRAHAQLVAEKLHGVAKRVRVIELPDVGGKSVKDAADFFGAGGTAEQLRAIAGQAPDWRPAEAATEVVPNSDTIKASVRGDILKLVLDQNTPREQKRSLIAETAFSALLKVGRFYFHAELRDFDGAMFFDTFRKRLERVRSDAFVAWLSEWLGINIEDQNFKFIVGKLATAALHGPRTVGIIPEAFWAARSDALYISSGDGQAVKVSARGPQLVDNGTDDVLFASGRTLLSWNLVDPRDPFESCTVFKNLHAEAEHGPLLLRVWIYSLPSLPRCKPPLCLSGEIGSGKTRTAKAIAELYGLPFVAHKVSERGEEQFWPSIDQGGLLILDNADMWTKWLPDAISNAATDGCSQRRKLYTNSDIVTLRPRAWLCVTSANPTFASDAGLADRLLLVRMARRNEESIDNKLTDEILAARDAGLSHIATTLRAALADTQPTPGDLNHRHPDWASLAVRIGRAIGREEETIVALRSAEADKSTFCLENDLIAPALLTYLRQEGEFTGTAKELKPHLVEIDGDLEEKVSARSLGKKLSALRPHLEKLLVTYQTRKSHNQIVYILGAPKDKSEDGPELVHTPPPNTDFFRPSPLTEPDPAPRSAGADIV